MLRVENVVFLDKGILEVIPDILVYVMTIFG